MTGIEELLREELRREAARARPELLTPLREPSPVGGRTAARGAARARFWLAPLAAGVAVAVVAAGIAVVARIAGPPDGSGRGQQAATAHGAMPPFYVRLYTNLVVVRESQTGKIISRLQLPPVTGHPSKPEIAAAADGLTYVISVRGEFFRFRLAADGRSARAHALPIPPLATSQFVESIALTPNGRHLAMAIQLPAEGINGRNRGEIIVASTRTGAERTFRPGDPGMSWQVSWAGNNTLAVAWESEARRAAMSARQTGLWLLNTRAPGSRLFSGQRFRSSLDPQSSAILPGARAAIFSTDGITQIDAHTGASRVLISWAHGNVAPCSILSVAPAGNHALIQCGKFGRIDNGAFTSLPGVPTDTTTPVAW